MNLKPLFLPFFIVHFFSLSTFSQTTRVLLNEDFSEWNNIPLIYDDPLGDNNGNPVDFGKFSGFNDDNFLFFFIEVGSEIAFQENNAIIIYLDTDNNASTGFGMADIGAELVYTFGSREGTAYLNGFTFTVDHEDIGLVSSPTVISNIFEICFDRTSSIGGNNLFVSDFVRVVLVDNDGTDILPDAGSVSYSFSNHTLEPLPGFSINKTDPSHLRILSYNVYFDNLFDTDKFDNYQRILNAINPEIFAFQEIVDHSAAQTVAKIEEMMPGSGPWYAEKIEDDLVVVSKFEILQTFEIIPFDYFKINGAFLLDLQDEYGTDLLLINAHLKSSGGNTNDTKRQKEADAIMAFIREAKISGGELTIPENTPIVIVGDMNLVGSYLPRTTLLTGDIIDNTNYGLDFIPDWDNSDFDDAKPYVTSLPMTFTWPGVGSSFSAGRLDYAIYSGSVLHLQNSFVLHTPSLPNDILIDHNLQTNDVTIASDHLPVVTDFEIDESVDVELVIFSGYQKENSVYLFWETASETNNKGFEIQRYLVPDISSQSEIWEPIAFVDGTGNSSINQKYCFTDAGMKTGFYFYRLKQIDLNGMFHFSKKIEVKVTIQPKYALYQNYPNPFNPSTTIKYEIAEPGFVTIKVFDLLGKEIDVLENEYKEAGMYSTKFDSKNLSSGIYNYILKTNDILLKRKMLLLR